MTSQREAWLLDGPWVCVCVFGGGGGCWVVFFCGWCGFSRESKNLFGVMECSSFRWLFLQNSA